jgi:hypothetical protein
VEHERFDRIAKSVGHRTSRRFVVRVGALVAGFSGLRRDIPVAEAAGDGDCQSLAPDKFISKHHCTRTNCGGSDQCVCVQTPGHVVRCAARFEWPKDCPQKDECSERRPCGRGRFCAKTFACCGGRDRRVCVRPCQG